MKTEGVAVPKPIRRAKRAKEFGRETEQRIVQKARQAGLSTAKRVPLSGALKGAGLDGDIDLGVALVEGKGRTPVERKEGKSISVSLAWWAKIVQEAALSGRIPAVWVHPKGSPNDFVLLSDDAYLSLVTKASRVSGEE